MVLTGCYRENLSCFLFKLLCLKCSFSSYVFQWKHSMDLDHRYIFLEKVFYNVVYQEKHSTVFHSLDTLFFLNNNFQASFLDYLFTVALLCCFLKFLCQWCLCYLCEDSAHQ